MTLIPIAGLAIVAAVIIAVYWFCSRLDVNAMIENYVMADVEAERVQAAIDKASRDAYAEGYRDGYDKGLERARRYELGAQPSRDKCHTHSS